MQQLTLLLAFLASASAFTAPVSRALPVSRVSDVRAQFGTGNYDDSQSKQGFVLSPIAGGSKDFESGVYEIDRSGEGPAKLFAFIALVGLPVAFAVAIFNAPL